MKYNLALFIAKIAYYILKLLGRNATFFPGKVAIKICPDFLNHIKKPEVIIGVTGTNGKTTVCNIIIDILEDNGYKVLSNRAGSNLNFGLASSLLEAKGNEEIAVFEIDERSSKLIYSYIKPNYVVCTNLFRDSIRRNAHPEYIVNFINSYIPNSTTLILNADDLISCKLGPNNKKIYYGMDKLETDLTESKNIVKDITICPKCHTKLKYNYLKYHHIGNAYCPKCDFKSPTSDYLATNLDFNELKMVIRKANKTYTYPLISNSIFNIYNEIAAITVLTELKIAPTNIKKSLAKLNIVESRYTKETINGLEIIAHLAKGQNPIACSQVFNYVNSEKGNKEVIIMVDDVDDNLKSSENITWLYDTDFEFLNDPSIKKIIVGGARSKDNYLRLLLAGVDDKKIVCTDKELDAINYIDVKGIDKLFILYDLHATHIGLEVRDRVKELVGGNK